MQWLFHHIFLSFDHRLGRFRGLVLLNLRMLGGFFVVTAPFFWWDDREYERYGLRATPVAIQRQEVLVVRDDREETVRYIDIEYTDAHGRCHRQAIGSDRLPRECPREQVRVGDTLPEVEYLDYAPERCRFVVGRIPWWGVLFMGGGSLVAAGLVRWSAIWAPAGPSCLGGSGG